MANIDLRLGDCFEGLKSIPDKSIDLVVTDPPYGNTNCDFDCIVDEPTLLHELKRVIKPNRAVCIFCMLRMAVRLINIDPKWFRYEWIWAKNKGVGFLQARQRPLRQHELILIFGDGVVDYKPQLSVGKPYRGIELHTKQRHYGKLQTHFANPNDGFRYPTTLLPYANCNNVNAVHPTQKPADLCEYLIRTYSNPGDVILDPFAGSGTTAVAAINSDRSFIGWERDEGYYNAALKRIETAKIDKAERLPIDYD